MASVLEQVASADDLSPATLVDRMYEYYLPILKDQHDDYPKRIRDLEHLHTMAESYHSLGEFLNPVGSLKSRRMEAWRM